MVVVVGVDKIRANNDSHATVKPAGKAFGGVVCRVSCVVSSCVVSVKLSDQSDKSSQDHKSSQAGGQQRSQASVTL